MNVADHCRASFLGEHEPAVRIERDSQGSVLCDWCKRPIEPSDWSFVPWRWAETQLVIHEEPW